MFAQQIYHTACRISYRDSDISLKSRYPTGYLLFCASVGKGLEDQKCSSPVDCCPCPARRAWHLHCRPFPDGNENESLPVYQKRDCCKTRCFAAIPKFVILSEQSESKDLRTDDIFALKSVRRSFDSLRKSSIFFSRSG